MLVTRNYEAAEASNNSVFKKVIEGGHITEIIDAVECKSKKGNELMKFTFDVIEDNEFNHYFEKDARCDDNGNIIWPNGGTKYILPENPELLKQLVNCINSSNEDQVVITGGEELDFNQFRGKKVCCQFGLEEYYNHSNEIKSSIYIKGFYPISEVDEIEIPLVKLIDGTEITYEEYKKIKNKEEN